MVQIDLNEFIEKASKEKVEITINYEPDNIEITIRPWEPFRYVCPYKQEQGDDDGKKI